MCNCVVACSTLLIEHLICITPNQSPFTKVYTALDENGHDCTNKLHHRNTKNNSHVVQICFWYPRCPLMNNRFPNRYLNFKYSVHFTNMKLFFVFSVFSVRWKMDLLLFPGFNPVLYLLFDFQRTVYGQKWINTNNIQV